MGNKNRLLRVVCIGVFLACAGFPEGGLRAIDETTVGYRDDSELLKQLTSPNETDRFQVLDFAKTRSATWSAEAVQGVLTDIRPKNVSTLIFVLMEARNDILYQLTAPAKMSLLNSPGSFPNIAYYHARVRPSEGVNVLFKLYDSHESQKLVICKAMGETGLPEATAFLLEKTLQPQTVGSRLPLLEGLKIHRQTVDKAHIASLLASELDREEIIALSQLKTDFRPEELILLYRGNPRERAYALEYIFLSPEEQVDALQSVLTDMIANKQLTGARALVMSDRIRRSTDERVRKLCEFVLDRTTEIVTSRPP